jgi:uncharacterized protein (DUF1778 family)
MKQYEPPLLIKIPIPTEMTRRRGINSTGRYGGNLRIRCTNAEYDMIKREAEMLGITLAGFSRWCIVRVAQALIDHRKSMSTSMLGEESADET